MKKNVELEKAQEMLLRKVHTLPEENVNLLEAFGRVLSRDVFASLDGWNIKFEKMKNTVTAKELLK
jgi:molybdopterin biosynthesis enzyme